MTLNSQLSVEMTPRVMIVRQGRALACAGVTLGLAAAFMLTRLIRSLIFGVEAFDSNHLCRVSFLLAFITLLAGYIPAQRAARIAPLISMRCD